MLSVFHNEGDSLADLRSALDARFSDVEVRVFGCTALFSGRSPMMARPRRSACAAKPAGAGCARARIHHAHPATTE